MPTFIVPDGSRTRIFTLPYNNQYPGNDFARMNKNGYYYDDKSYNGNGYYNGNGGAVNRERRDMQFQCTMLEGGSGFICRQPHNGGSPPPPNGERPPRR